MNGLPKPCYVMSEPHLSGYRVVLGYETLTEAQDAQSALAASPPAREEAPAEGAGDDAQWLWRIPGRNWVLERTEPDVVREARVNGEWVKTEVIALSALRNRTSEPEAGAVAWFGDGQYEPTEAMIEAGLETCRPGNHANMIASFKSMMQQAELDGLVVAHPAPATADKLKVAKETLEKIARRTSITFGRGEMSNQEAFSLAEYGLVCLNEQPQ